MSSDLELAIARAAEAIRSADALLIAAGAGMGVDSGLPDFRGNEGFWQAYPPFRQRGLSFVDLANPHWFRTDPAQAWGFYGHRLLMYRSTEPHAGFQRLRAWAAAKPAGYFVFTSNVDGHFQKGGFDERRVVECHGSIHALQCSRPCTGAIWPAEDLDLTIDEQSFRAARLPACPHCGSVARPNVLMFSDADWLGQRSDAQWQRYHEWLAEIRRCRLAIIECGAGRAVPTVRLECQRRGGTLIRINVREPEVPAGGISIPLAAAAALEMLARRLENAAWP